MNIKMIIEKKYKNNNNNITDYINNESLEDIKILKKNNFNIKSILKYFLIILFIYFKFKN